MVHAAEGQTGIAARVLQHDVIATRMLQCQGYVRAGNGEQSAVSLKMLKIDKSRLLFPADVLSTLSSGTSEIQDIN